MPNAEPKLPWTMYFFSKLVTFLISPFGTALLAAAVALLCAARGRGRWAGTLGAAAMAWVWLWSTPAISNTVQMHMEAEFPPLPMAAVPEAGAAVVLGGAMSPPTATQHYANLQAAADRVWHAARLHHAGKVPLLVLSGGTDPKVTPWSEAQAMQWFLHDLGVADGALLLEGSSRTTGQSATSSALLLKQRGVDRILLVTSASHMARAKAHFEAAGMFVVAVAVDHTSPLALSEWTSWVPDAGALHDSGQAFKEVFGRWLVGLR